MGRAEKIIEEDSSGRSSVDRFYQASMIEYANGVQIYDNATDTHSFSFTREDYMKGKIEWGSGLDPGHFKGIAENYFTENPAADSIAFTLTNKGGLVDKEVDRVYNAVLPYELEIKDFKMEDKEKVDNELKDLLLQGKEIPVCLGVKLTGNGSGHNVLLEKIVNDYVYLRDPNGEHTAFGTPVDSHGNKIDTSRFGETPYGGHTTMSVEEFYKRLMNYFVPKDK
jgi:hypothetical protein